MKFKEFVRQNALSLFLTLAIFGLLAGILYEVDVIYWGALEYLNLTHPVSLLALAGFGLMGGVPILLSLLFMWFPDFLKRLKILEKLSIFRWFLFAFACIFPIYFLLHTNWGLVFTGMYTRLWLVLGALATIFWVIHAQSSSNAWVDILKAGIILGSILAIGVEFRTVVNYPFSLSWSEGNRIWDYSVLYGRRFYIFPPDKPLNAYIDSGRQSLWGLPFLLPNVSIWLVRFWSAVVFTLPYFLLGLFIFRREENRILNWIYIGLWSFLFLYQGPIYSPLVLAAILVVAATKFPTWLAFIVVALSGYYAQDSRETWMFAPAMWAGMVSLVQVSPYKVKNEKQRWIRAVSLVVAGLIGGYFLPELQRYARAVSRGVQAAPTVASVEGVTDMVGRQPLLWERLLPNPTYGPGILLGLSLATLPLVILLVLFAVRGKWKLNIWQKLALIGGLTAFLAVGLVVSVKIGGGSNLHNLDMYLIGLLLTTGLAWEAGAKDWINNQAKQNKMVQILLLAAVLFPALNGIMSVEKQVLPSGDVVNEALTTIQEEVEAAQQNGEILFMDQRQLLTFEYVDDVPLVADYEKKRVMDMAMGNNTSYLDKMYQDLADHRFELIVTEPIRIQYSSESNEFGSENDVWVKRVSVPMTCYYESIAIFDEVGVELLVPRDEVYVPSGEECPY